MKRGELRPDPVKVREFLQRKRQPLTRRKGLERGGQLKRTPLAPGKRKHRWRVPLKVRQAVLGRTYGACAACLVPVGLDPYEALERQVKRLLRDRTVRRAVHLHHCLPVERWPALEREPDNLVGVCAECHDNHERAHVRIPREAVPGCTLALAAAVGAAEQDYIAKTYPPAGGRPPGRTGHEQ